MSIKTLPEALSQAGISGWSISDLDQAKDVDDAYDNFIRWFDDKGRLGAPPKATREQVAAALAAYVSPALRDALAEIDALRRALTKKGAITEAEINAEKGMS